MKSRAGQTLLDIEMKVGDHFVFHGHTYMIDKIKNGFAYTVELGIDDLAPENKHGHCWHRVPDGYSRDGKRPPIANDWKCCHCGRYGNFEGMIPDGHGPHYIGPGIPTFNGNVLTCPGNREQRDEE